MDRIPFSKYDLIACFVPGLLVVGAFNVAFQHGSLLSSAPSVVAVAIVVAVAFIVGQVLANLSGFLLERTAACAALGPSEELLLEERGAGSHPEHALRAWLFPGYYEPFPPATRRRILERAERDGLCAGRDLFVHAHSLVRRDAAVQARLATFLLQYGFCRNTSLALVVTAGIFALNALAAPAFGVRPVSGAAWWIAASLSGAIVLFYRFLNFYKDYTAEVLKAYGQGEVAGATDAALSGD